jgi:hypothetical protein
MANLSITTLCNRRCGYCFAGLSSCGQFMRRKDFTTALDLLEASGITEARLLGGEPTLHPEFPALVAEALARGFTLRVFSNGLMPERALASLLEVPAERCGVLLNIHRAEDQTPEEYTRTRLTATRLGLRANAGINIYRPGMDLGFVFGWIEECGLAPLVRLGLAHPRFGGGNDYLAPKHYPVVGRELTAFAREANARDVRLDPDCGFVPCMFPPEFFEITGISAHEIGIRCGPVPDILPDLSAISCYSLAPIYRLPVSGTQSIGETRDRFITALNPSRHTGIYQDCGACQWRATGACTGGCQSAALRRTRATTPPVRLAATTSDSSPTNGRRSEQAQWTLPYIDQPAEFWRELAADHGSRVKAVYFPPPSGLLGTGRPRQPEQHLTDFLRQEDLPKHVLLNPVKPRAPIREIGQAVVDEVAALAEEFGVAGATVTDPHLAELLRRRLPSLELTASTLMEVAEPEQAAALRGLFDVLVPASGILHRVLGERNILRELQAAFGGKLRLLLNEGCLPNCRFRKQHFEEMADGRAWPQSLCAPSLETAKWRRLTGGWVLPQLLHWLDGFGLEYKLAGRVTLANPVNYRRVCDAYLTRTALWPHQIGAGPASMLEPLAMREEFLRFLLGCGGSCGTCRLCERAAGAGIRPESESREYVRPEIREVVA